MRQSWVTGNNGAFRFVIVALIKIKTRIFRFPANLESVLHDVSKAYFV